VVTADCVPVFLFDPVRRAVGLVHSGWRGTAECIAPKAAALLQEQYGSRPEDLLVCLGPHICGRCYEVGAELIPPFRASFSEAECGRFFPPAQAPGKYLLDLSEAIRLSLTRAGVPPEQIRSSGRCTFEDPRLCSWRRDKQKEERILSVIALL
jgi:YfiH family protein